MPYAAANIADFWRRWHISLSTWLRDYLYVPLGGNRHGTAATYRNLTITMVLGGLWHGAAWNFILWGLYHGALLAAHRAFGARFGPAKGPLQPVKIAFTFLCVCIGWVLFRAESLNHIGIILRRMVIFTEGQNLSGDLIPVAFAAWLAVAFGHLLGSSVPINRLVYRLPAPALATAMAVLFLFVQVLMPHRGGAFIYFQF
jgi:alginate O-acetyltransferase complex protein AlgI